MPTLRNKRRSPDTRQENDGGTNNKQENNKKKKRKFNHSVANSPGSSMGMDLDGASSGANSDQKQGAGVVARLGSVIGSVIATFRSPQPIKKVQIDDNNNNTNNDNNKQAKVSSTSRFNYDPIEKTIEQPKITVSSNGRVRTPSLKTVKLTPELIKLIRAGEVTEEQARNIMLNDIKCNNNMY